jgi:hypothetical protein
MIDRQLQMIRTGFMEERRRFADAYRILSEDDKLEWDRKLNDAAMALVRISVTTSVYGLLSVPKALSDYYGVEMMLDPLGEELRRTPSMYSELTGMLEDITEGTEPEEWLTRWSRYCADIDPPEPKRYICTMYMEVLAHIQEGRRAGWYLDSMLPYSLAEKMCSDRDNYLGYGWDYDRITEHFEKTEMDLEHEMRANRTEKEGDRIVLEEFKMNELSSEEIRDILEGLEEISSRAGSLQVGMIKRYISRLDPVRLTLDKAGRTDEYATAFDIPYYYDDYYVRRIGLKASDDGGKTEIELLISKFEYGPAVITKDPGE